MNHSKQKQKVYIQYGYSHWNESIIEMYVVSLFYNLSMCGCICFGYRCQSYLGFFFSKTCIFSFVQDNISRLQNKKKWTTVIQTLPINCN